MIGDVVGDYFFTCPTNNFALKCAENQMTVYYYHFTQVIDSIKSANNVKLSIHI